MKYLPFLFLLTGCSLFNDPEPITVISTLPVDVYNLAGGTGLEITQSDALGLLTSVQATVEGTSFVFIMPTCKISYDVQVRDPVYFLFWLRQPLTMNYDPNIVMCGNVATCRIDPLSISMNGTIATATFSCP